MIVLVNTWFFTVLSCYYSHHFELILLYLYINSLLLTVMHTLWHLLWQTSKLLKLIPAPNNRMLGGVPRCSVTICDQITLQCKQNQTFCKNQWTTFQPLPRVQFFFDIIIQYIVTNGLCFTIMSRCVLDPILLVNQSKSITPPPVIVVQ